MRRMLQGRAGTGLAFLLGLLLATAGTATAAKLITGKQIKDGTIASKDLSKAVRAQLKKSGTAGKAGSPGVKGDKGDPGSAGPVGPSDVFMGTRRGSVTLTTATPPGDLVVPLILPAGSYAVTASASLENQDATFPTTATCELAVGNEKVEATAKLSKAADGGFRDVAALTVAASLTAPGSATLKCATGNGVTARARDSRIVAVKVNSLTVQDSTPPS